MKQKKFKLEANQIVQMITPMGSCIASDKITVEGLPVTYMYRETPDLKHDSGWRFFSGTETEEYVDDPDNFAFYDVNTIVNYDASIIPYLDSNIGTEWGRTEDMKRFDIIER